MRVSLLLLLLAVVAAPVSAQTDVFTWSAGASGGDWDDGTNWNGCVETTGSPSCSFPLGTGDVAILPNGSVVSQQAVTRTPDELRVSGVATVTGLGAVSVDLLTLASGSTLAVESEVRAVAVSADASSEVAGGGRLQLLDDVALTVGLSVGTVDCFNSSGETCDLTGAAVTASELWMTGGGLLLVDGSAAGALDVLYIDARPLGGGGPVPGDITFTGAPATFDLASIRTVDYFGTVDFNGGSGTVANVLLGSANQEGLRNFEDLTVTGSMEWNGGTVETAGAFTVAEGATVQPVGNNYVKGRTRPRGPTRSRSSTPSTSCPTPSPSTAAWSACSGGRSR